MKIKLTQIMKLQKLKPLNNKLDLDRMIALKNSSSFSKAKFDNLKIKILF